MGETAIKQQSAEEAFVTMQAASHVHLVDVRTLAELAFVGQASLSFDHVHHHTVEWSSFPDGQLNEGFTDKVSALGIPNAAPIYLLCRSGARSLAAAQALAAAGFTDLTNISDGFEGDLDAQHKRGNVNGWKASGLPWKQS